MDIAYTKIKQDQFYLEHKYGENINISQNIVLLNILERLGRKETLQPLFNILLNRAYDILFQQVLSLEFEKEELRSKTRMSELVEGAAFNGEVLKRDSKIVCVDLARAGMLPTQNLFELCNLLFNTEKVRQDHVYAQRIVNENEQVTGVDFSGSKIGGDIENAYVILADPMGATGSTIDEALSFYKNQVKGKACKFISVHLMITPEFIKKLKAQHPDLIIFAGRIDRGLSSEKVLRSTPGEFLDEEKGLSDIQYIVPGAGGVGELINNSFV